MYDSDNYVLDEGALYHLYTPRTKKLHRAYAVVKQLCIPDSMKPQIAKGLHENLAHAGIQRVFATARSRYYLSNMHEFLKNHILSCSKCQQSKRQAHPQKTPVLSMPIQTPSTRFVMDYHGSFQESTDGARYILTVVDSSSMWPELIPTRDQTAETTIKHLFSRVISRFGLPRGISLQSDLGAAFTAKLTDAFCKTFNIKHHFSSPHHHQPDSRAEQMGETIHKSIRVLCENKRDWADHLPAIEMAYRATATSNLELSPHEVLFGRKMVIPVDWSILAEDPAVGDALAYAQAIRPKIEILQAIAMENARDSAHNAANRANKDSTTSSYQVGDKVLLFDPTNKVGESPKLQVKWSGPFFITESTGNFNYKLKNVNTGKEIRRAIHGSRLRAPNELNNDYRLQDDNKGLTLFEHATENDRLKIT